ncbi:nucleotidyltransferase family protein [Shewanella gaetbuli]|uniref:Nucleotidyltransferase family protein n=1 Tax=Shewanella gaetbuli TaxID=220752 RepID=A0A9X1ZN57_9GAMM|nr:nucleotidyltransferase family protein [Shewanella gaetbuli]MCL1144027.1 nucleotidyltransferase family protein [Shewanella gaetbuli]
MTPVNQAELSLKVQISQWLSQDVERMQALQVCAQVFFELGIDQWAIAAGFVRNLVWDKLHGKPASKLNDVDVIYFEPLKLDPVEDKLIEQQLCDLLAINWSVKNQARMHIRNGDSPYLNLLDAMSYWPEKQTAVAVHIEHKPLSTKPMSFNIIHAFDIQCLFDFTISHNPKRDMAIFNQRVRQKNWLNQYPKLTLC